jgi:threonine aldolase
MRSASQRVPNTRAARSGRGDQTASIAAPDVIDLRSDFLARGTPAMAEASARAAREPYHFGLREDPYQVALERRIAEMTAHEDALVFPTCTMANLVGIMLGAAPGTRALTHEDAHVITSEAGGAAAFAGVQLVPLAGDPPNGSVDQWRIGASAGDAQKPATSLFVLENTHNRAGGMPLPAAYTAAVLAVARERGIATHLDGSRLFHAAAALGTTVATLAEGFDTVSLSFNKGFGAPLAAALAGSRESIARALILRQRLGGGIRPTGPAAAATLAALDDLTHFTAVQRLAQRLARGLALLPGVRIVPTPATNIVVVELTGDRASALDAQARLADRGLLALPFGEARLRLVTYRGLTEAQIDRAVAAAGEALARG